MDTRNAILDYLQESHTGRQRAVFSRELERLFSIDGRTVRRHISKLRQAGYPICSDESGYYYADNQTEINNTVGRLNELVTKVSNARTGLLYSSVLTDRDLSVEISIKFMQGVFPLP